MNILLTGASGAFGAAACRALQRLGGLDVVVNAAGIGRATDASARRTRTCRRCSTSTSSERGG